MLCDLPDQIDRRISAAASFIDVYAFFLYAVLLYDDMAKSGGEMNSYTMQQQTTSPEYNKNNLSYVMVK
jgi:hypothetical protein